MKLYLPTTIATLMLLGAPSFSAAAKPEFRLRGSDEQKQYTDEDWSSPAIRRLFDHDSQPRLDWSSPAIRRIGGDPNINSFAATQNDNMNEERDSPAVRMPWPGLPGHDLVRGDSPEFRRRILDNDSQPRLYYNNDYDAVQSNINSFAATSSSSSEFDIRHAFCYTWDGQAARPNPSWPVMHTREPHRHCVNHCIDLRGCTGWEWRQNRNECHFFDTRTGGNFLPTSGSELCGWKML